MHVGMSHDGIPGGWQIDLLIEDIWYVEVSKWSKALAPCEIYLIQENVHALLGKMMESKRLLIQEGNHQPTKEELARHVGITVNKLEKLLYTTRLPLSMQKQVWADQDTTFQVMLSCCFSFDQI